MDPPCPQPTKNKDDQARQNGIGKIYTQISVSPSTHPCFNKYAVVGALVVLYELADPPTPNPTPYALTDPNSLLLKRFTAAWPQMGAQGIPTGPQGERTAAQDGLLRYILLSNKTWCMTSFVRACVCVCLCLGGWLDTLRPIRLGVGTVHHRVCVCVCMCVCVFALAVLVEYAEPYASRCRHSAAFST